MKNYSIYFFILYSGILFSQTKYENETRVKINEVPPISVDFVNEIIGDKKIKWYKEYDGTHITFEAKSCHKDHHISIEFAQDGTFEDAEVTIKEREIFEEARKDIKGYLSNKYRRYRFKKIQRQISGNPQAVKNYLTEGLKSDSLIFKYEIVLKGISKEEKNWYEFLFDQGGKLVQKYVIEVKNSDHLEY